VVEHDANEEYAAFRHDIPGCGHDDHRVGYVTDLPLVVKLHLVGGFVVLALFPFTRLVHVVALSVTCIFRPIRLLFGKLAEGRSG